MVSPAVAAVIAVDNWSEEYIVDAPLCCNKIEATCAFTESTDIASKAIRAKLNLFIIYSIFCFYISGVGLSPSLGFEPPVVTFTTSP